VSNIAAARLGHHNVAAMAIRMRVRGPNRTETIQAEETWALKQLVELIQEKFEVSSFKLKTGFPPENLDLSDDSRPLADFGLNNAALTLDPEEAQSKPDDAETASSKLTLPTFTPKRPQVDDTSIEWAEVDGYLGKQIR
jgi:hypothetical protein